MSHLFSFYQGTPYQMLQSSAWKQEEGPPMARFINGKDAEAEGEAEER